MQGYHYHIMQNVFHRTHQAITYSDISSDMETVALNRIATHQKRTRRSEIPKFVWKEDCFFCGEKCDMQRDPKHPDRFRSAYECHTSDRPGVSSKTFKDTVLKVFIFLF